MTPAEALRRIVDAAKGDDLERAIWAYRNRTDSTSRKVIEEYKEGRRIWESAKALLEDLLTEKGL